MKRQLCGAFAFVAALSLGQCLQAAPVTVINPGAEAYPGTATLGIAQSPIPPGDGTGWNSTLPQTVGEEGVETLANQTDPSGGARRLAFGAVNTSATDTTPDTNLADDFILFQQTPQVIALGDVITMIWIGRGFFQYDIGTDLQTSLFGYLDGSNQLVPVDTLPHPTVITGTGSGGWTPQAHSFVVPLGSPLIGEQLVIGFFTDTPDQASGGFSSVDNVTLDVTRIPEPTSLALGLAGLAAVGACRRGRKS